MKYFFSLLFSFLLQITFAQNLVLNPSFENYNCNKIEKLANIEQLLYCYNPNKGSPDVYNIYSKDKFYKSPNNGSGYQKPHFGNIYVGIVIGHYLKSDLYNVLKEYITLELKEELKLNSTYCISMYISLANNSNYASNGIGVYLSKDKIVSDDKYLLRFPSLKIITPNLYHLSNEIIKDTTNWILICDTIRALGGEKFITIGNFKSDDSTTFIRIHRRPNSYFDPKLAYYFIDDVSVSLSNGKDCNCRETKPALVTTVQPHSIKGNVPIVMEQLYFETNKYEILPASFSYLDSLCLLLVKTENSIEISGHTDNIGAEKDNQQLSENRAKAVMAYMISKGIAASRITATGYGSSKPITGNTSEQGRSQNRRVEFVIKKE